MVPSCIPKLTPACCCAGGTKLLTEAVDAMKLSARGYHRALRVARTLADLEGSEGMRRPHVAEALSYRRINLRQ